MRAIKRIPGPNICLLIPAPFRCDETTVSASFPPYTDRSTRHLSELKQNQSSDIAIKIFATSRKLRELHVLRTPTQPFAQYVQLAHA
ncbi:MULTISPECIES: hypothetical protein [Burkholderia]|uniref:hypothetical protein n=1 Tax=Burkholderia TaxID=32008 RepID=UPI001645F283|nr:MULTISPECIES: hypothetical protein [Burkholderia]